MCQECQPILQREGKHAQQKRIWPQKLKSAKDHVKISKSSSQTMLEFKSKRLYFTQPNTAIIKSTYMVMLQFIHIHYSYSYSYSLIVNHKSQNQGTFALIFNFLAWIGKCCHSAVGMCPSNVCLVAAGLYCLITGGLPSSSQPLALVQALVSALENGWEPLDTLPSLKEGSTKAVRQLPQQGKHNLQGKSLKIKDLPCYQCLRITLD